MMSEVLGEIGKPVTEDGLVTGNSNNLSFNNLDLTVFGICSIVSWFTLTLFKSNSCVLI